jgi:hypothetical protein
MLVKFYAAGVSLSSPPFQGGVPRSGEGVLICHSRAGMSSSRRRGRESSLAGSCYLIFVFFVVNIEFLNSQLSIVN